MSLLRQLQGLIFRLTLFNQEDYSVVDTCTQTALGLFFGTKI